MKPAITVHHTFNSANNSDCDGFDLLSSGLNSPTQRNIDRGNRVVSNLRLSNERYSSMGVQKGQQTDSTRNTSLRESPSKKAHFLPTEYCLAKARKETKKVTTFGNTYEVYDKLYFPE
jgi:hypothetical protein